MPQGSGGWAARTALRGARELGVQGVVHARAEGRFFYQLRDGCLDGPGVRSARGGISIGFHFRMLTECVDPCANRRECRSQSPIICVRNLASDNATGTWR